MFKKLIILCVTCFLFACSSNYQTQDQVASGSYLQLEGDFVDTTMVLDDQQIELKKVKTFTFNGKNAARFPIDEGNHKIIILRDSQEIIKQFFFTANNETFRILVQ